MRYWLVEKRSEHDMTQKEVANASGITRQYYSYIEKSLRTPSLKTAMKIGKALGFKYTRFFDEHE